MSAMTVHLQSATQYERFDGVISFVGEDASGSFGVLPGHEPLLTCLEFGLAHFRTAAGELHYIAVPGAVLRFSGNDLHVSARRYLRDLDYRRIAAGVREDLAAEDAKLADMKERLQRLETEMLRRLWLAQRETGAVL